MTTPEPHATPDATDLTPGDTHAGGLDADTPEGRFILIGGPGSGEVAGLVTQRLPKAATVDGATVASMFAADATPGLEATFLRYTSGIALADSFRFAGFDAVVVDDVPTEHLEAYLDFAAPALVHLVRIGETDADVPGLHLDPGEAGQLATTILERLDEARVETASTGDETD